MGLARARAEHPRATLISESYLQAAMKHARTETHAPESHPFNTALLGRDTRAVVEYLQEEPIPVMPVAQLNVLRPAMSEGVVDAFLGDAVEMRRNLRFVNFILV